MAVVSIDLPEAREALRAAAAATAELVGSCSDPSLAVPHLGWSVAQVGTHLRGAGEGFAAAAAGGPIELDLPKLPSAKQRVAYVNARTVEGVEESDPGVVANGVEQGADAFLEATRGWLGPERVPTPWYGQGVALEADAATCVLVGEYLVHGWDLAAAMGRRWLIPPRHAALAFAGLTAMMPLYVNPVTAAGVRATWDIGIRGGVRFTVAVSDGALTVTPPADKVDCHLRCDPVAGLLVAYGRQGQAVPILGGKLVAWGRKPWLALTFKGLILDP